MAKIPPDILKWRNSQKEGSIMKPSTFKKIESDALRRGLSKESARAEAGKAYWNAVKSKRKKSVMKKAIINYASKNK